MTQPDPVPLDPILNDPTHAHEHPDLPTAPMPAVNDPGVQLIPPAVTLATYVKQHDWTGWTIDALNDSPDPFEQRRYVITDPEGRGQGVYSSPAEVDARIGRWTPILLPDVDPATGMPFLLSTTYAPLGTPAPELPAKFSGEPTWDPNNPDFGPEPPA